jgi:integrase
VKPAAGQIKREYFTWLREAKQQSEASVDAVAAALARFEAHTRYRDFKNFHHQQAVAFKRHLAAQDSQATGEKLSKATQYATLLNLKRFFQWLAGQPGYKSGVQYADADYFSLPAKESRVATARRERPVPTLEQVQHVISQMPAGSDIEMRNRALVAFILLTGARDSAVASFKLKHIDLATDRVHQDAREVNTKFSKTFATFFFPVGADIRQIVADWVTYLRVEKLWGSDDPLFPKTKVVVGGNGQFAPMGLERAHWSDATPIRKIFHEAFTAAGLPYFNPHSLRSTLVKIGEKACQTPEAFKAWSQNLGHDGVLTTFISYGSVATHRQGEIIRNLSARQGEVQVTPEVIEAVLRHVAREAGRGV